MAAGDDLAELIIALAAESRRDMASAHVVHDNEVLCFRAHANLKNGSVHIYIMRKETDEPGWKK
jgi:hypothetical protein